MDLEALVQGPLYRTWGVPATLRVPDRAAVSLTVLDYTTPQDVPGGDLERATIEPRVGVRKVDIANAGLGVLDLRGATIEFNGNTWSILAADDYALGSAAGDGEWQMPVQRAY